MSKKSKYQIWAIYSEEEQPVGLSWAKTESGAKRIHEEQTGRSRYTVHAEPITFAKQHFAFHCDT